MGDENPSGTVIRRKPKGDKFKPGQPLYGVEVKQLAPGGCGGPEPICADLDGPSAARLTGRGAAALEEANARWSRVGQEARAEWGNAGRAQLERGGCS